MKKLSKTSKRIQAFFVFFLFSLSPAFSQAAQIMPAGMTSLAKTILDIFTGPVVRTILAIFLCGSAIAYAFNKDNEKIKRNAIAVGIAAAILIGASGIVDAVWRASGGTV